MKILLPLLIFLNFPFFAEAQINFEKGYYINNLDQRVEGFIKNSDWKNNPSEFEFEVSESNEPNTITLNYAKEFGFEEGTKYIRNTVALDRSTSNLTNLSQERQPDFEEVQIFLEVLIDGEAKLYRYEDFNAIRYFYNLNGSPIEPLIYKEYFLNQKLKKNQSYRQELYSNLTCEALDEKDFERLKYSRQSLERIFIKYNSCKDSDFSNYKQKEKRPFIHLNLRPGLKNSSLNVIRYSTIGLDPVNIEFNDKWNLRFGLEAEFILPFNKDKWSVIIEPTYQSYKAETTIDMERSSVDYKSIELPLGIRHYMFLNKQSKIFLNASFSLDFSLNSTFNYRDRLDISITSRSNLALGAGFKYNDKYSLEFRYDLNRDLLSDYTYYTSDFSGISLIFGYTLF
ncbi:MAG: outer membrane beta-barrel protein [Leeuwenhoekiella sp.]